MAKVSYLSHLSPVDSKVYYVFFLIQKKCDQFQLFPLPKTEASDRGDPAEVPAGYSFRKPQGKASGLRKQIQAAERI